MDSRRKAARAVERLIYFLLKRFSSLVALLYRFFYIAGNLMGGALGFI
jgi:hypothetical protein